MPRLTQVTSASPHFLCFGVGLPPSALSLSAMLLVLVLVLVCLMGWHPLGGEGACLVSQEGLEERAQPLLCRSLQAASLWAPASASCSQRRMSSRAQRAAF